MSDGVPQPIARERSGRTRDLRVTLPASLIVGLLSGIGGGAAMYRANAAPPEPHAVPPTCGTAEVLRPRVEALEVARATTQRDTETTARDVAEIKRQLERMDGKLDELRTRRRR